MKRPVAAFLSACFLAASFFCTNADALGDKGGWAEVRAVVGAKSMIGIGWASIPMPLTFEANLDIKKYLRFHLEVTHHLAENVDRPGLGAGAAFPVYGKTAPIRGGLQIKIPVLLEVAVAVGDVEARDGHTYYYRRMLIGPSTGIDFTWWAAEKAGFCLAVSFGYMFQIELPEDHGDYDMRSEELLGVFEPAVLLGVAF